MKIGVVGLGKMGQQIVKKLVDGGHKVVAFDVNKAAVEACKEYGAVGVVSREDLVEQLGPKPIVWMMIPAEFVDAEVDTLLKLLPKGSMLIDGGNSRYTQTIERAKRARKKGMSYVDVGTSGGVHGMTHGFSLMVGGSSVSFTVLEPALKTLAAPKGGYAYMGQSGRGHYVKMVHNGIEYAIMQAYAEGYDLLKYGEFKDIKLAEVARVWQQGSIIESNLNGLIQEIFEEMHHFEYVSGYVAATGEGQWTYETAQKYSVPMPALREALQVRAASQNGYDTFATKLLALMRNKFGGHDVRKKK